LTTPKSTEPANIPPSPNRADPPDFFRLEAGPFEEMTCALFEKEPGISLVDLYRTAFQPQFGIDVIAERTSGDGIEVASCKCYSTISKGKIPEWSTDFLKHWDTHWKDKRVRRFILVVAANVNSQERDAEVEVEKKRFERHGIKYEVWAPRTLQEKIRPHPGLVSQHLGFEWVSRLCGIVSPPAPQATGTVNLLSNLVIRQVEELQTALSGEVLHRIDRVRELMRTGDNAQVTGELESLRDGKNWQQLTPAVQAQIICLQASLMFKQGDLSNAEQLANEADAIAPSYTAKVRALIANERFGPAEALVALGEPQSLDVVQLRVALLLEAGKGDEAVFTLGKSPLLEAGDAETARLRAFTALLQGNREQAYIEVCKAEQLAPSWTAVKRAGALVRYALAISPHVPSKFLLTPSPIAIELVKEDDLSQQYLREALKRFQSLSGAPNWENQRYVDETWEVACLCNIRGETDAAKDKCVTVLKHNPCHPEVIAWALARGIEFDAQRSIEKLQERLNSTKGTSSHVLAYAWILVSQDEISSAMNVLAQYQDRFTSPAEQAALQERLSGFAAMQGKGASNGRTEDLGVMIEHANLTGNWESVEALFVAQAKAKPTPLQCLATAEVLAAKKRWRTLSGHITALLSFETSTAIRIAAYAAFNSRHPEQACSILKEGRCHFQHGVLPHDLRVLEVHSLSMQGNAAGALKRATLLAAETSTPADRLLTADLHIRAGDLAGALPAIREASQLKTLGATDALRFAAVVSVEDVELARELWRHAFRAGIPDHFVTVAMSQAYRLGIDKEATPLFSTLNRLAAEPNSGVYLVDIEGIIEQQRQLRENAAHAEEQYCNGAIPIHAFAEVFQIDLAGVYQLKQPQQYRVGHHKLFFIRNGARPAVINIGVPLNSWHLHMDVTALLLAAQLQLLEILEALPNSISIPSSLPQALVQLELKASHHQPKFLQAQREISDAMVSKKITPYRVDSVGNSDAVDMNSAMAWASQQGGVAIDHKLPVDADVFDAARLATVIDVAQSLRNTGALDATQFAMAIESLGELSSSSNRIHIAPGTPVLFLSNTLTVLANAGLLDAISNTYDVYVDNWSIHAAEAECRQADEQEKIKAVIGNLRRRISQGIINGKYVTATLPDKLTDESAGDDGEEDKRRRGDSEAQNGLIEFVKISPATNSVFWIDDRYLSGFPTIQDAPLVGVFEVLGELRNSGRLSETEYFSALIQLRASGAMFLPISSEEALYHLHAAPIVDGEIVDTPALSTIRRYVANVLLSERYLKIGQYPEGLEGRPDEILVLMELRKLADACLVELWQQDDIELTALRARSNWLWKALNAERLLSQHPSITQNAESVRTLPALDLASLLVHAIQMSNRHVRGGLTRRAAYIQWVDEAVLNTRCNADSLLEAAISDTLKQLISGLLTKERDDTFSIKYGREIRHILGQTVSSFPERLQSQILQDTKLAKELGLQTVQVLTEGKQQFYPQPFWRAVAKAMKYGRAVIHTSNTKERVVLSRSVRRDFEVQFSGENNRYFADPALALLTENVDECRKVLLNHVDWFDVRADERLDASERILNKTVGTRMQALDEVRARSAAIKYADLHNKAKTGKALTFELCLPPPGHALLAHLRLEPGLSRPFTDKLELSAGIVVDEYGLEKAFERFAGLPCPIPNHIIDSFQILDDAAKLDLMKRMRRNALTPLRIIHTLRLQLAMPAHLDAGECVKFSDWSLKGWSDLANAFIAVLRWTVIANEKDEHRQSLDPIERLAVAWLHADKLFCVLVGNGFSPDVLLEAFSSHRPGKVVEEAFLRTAAENEIAWHEFVSADAILYHGLGYILGKVNASDAFNCEQIETIRQMLLVNPDADTSQAVSPWLMVNREVGGNLLGSFLNMRPQGLFDGEVDSVKAVARFEDMVVRSVEENPYSRDSWISASLLVRPAVSESAAQRLISVIRALDFVKLFSSAEEGTFICRLVANCVSRFGDDELRKLAVSQLTAVAKKLSLSFGGRKTRFKIDDDTQQSKELAQLLEGYALLSKSEKAEKSFELFGTAVTRLAEVWPDTAPALTELLSGLYAATAIPVNKHLWEALLTLRARY
jgi:hypothetical protein